MRNAILAAVIAATAVPVSFAVAEPAQAQRWDRHDRDGIYDRYGRYREPRALSRRDRVWRGRDGRYYCKRDNGTTGLIVGGAVGALLGREIAGRGERTLGTIIGAAGGGLLGREIDRGKMKCR
jgi:uncharacterized protein YcfJ